VVSCGAVKGAPEGGRSSVVAEMCVERLALGLLFLTLGRYAPNGKPDGLKPKVDPKIT
jgi:hypothetical protein